MLVKNSTAGLGRDIANRTVAAVMGLMLPALAGPAFARVEGGLTERECVRAALEANPAMKLAASRRAEASGRVVQVGSQSRPQIGLSTSYMVYDWLPPNKEKILGGGSTDIYSEIVVSQLISSFGRIEGSAESARARLTIEEETLRRAAQTVAFRARTAFHEHRYALTAAAYYAEAEEQMQRHLKVAQELVSAGKAAPLDVLRAEVHLANVSQSLVRARNTVESTRLALNEVMGRQLGLPVALEPPDADPPLPPRRTLEEVMRNHPDARAAALAVRRAEAELRSARASAAPTLVLRGNLNYEGGRDPLAISNWNAAVALTLPIWDSGNRKGLVMQAQASLAQARSSQEITERRIELEYSTARLAVEEAYRRVTTSLKAVELAMEALRVVQEKYTVGLGSSIEVIDAQVALTQSHANRAQAETDYRLSLARLSLAAGDEVLEGPQG